MKVVALFTVSSVRKMCNVNGNVKSHRLLSLHIFASVKLTQSCDSHEIHRKLHKISTGITQHPLMSLGILLVLTSSNYKHTNEFSITKQSVQSATHRNTKKYLNISLWLYLCNISSISPIHFTLKVRGTEWESNYRFFEWDTITKISRTQNGNACHVLYV